MTGFPEILPADAGPDIAALYADIQAVSGVPVVNLIWRHMAALPGVLAWAWGAVRPLVASTELRVARERVARAATLPGLPATGRAAWAAAGVSASSRPQLAALLDDYVRGNCTNIVALTALRLRLEGHGGPVAILTPAPAPPPAPPLPPLPRIEALDPALARAVRALAARHEGAGGGVIPSIYLALAPWPGVIAALPAWLGPLYAPEALRAARTSTQRAAEEAAAALLPAPGPAPGPAPAGAAALRPTLDRFTRLVIPDLIPVCVALRDALGTA